MNTYIYDRFPNTLFWEISKQPNDKSLEMFQKITPEVQKLVKDLENKLIDLHHNLIKRWWCYIDLKLDNIGYKKIDEDIKLYFIDDDFGLIRYNEEKLIYKGYVDDHRNTDNAWMETTAFHYHFEDEKIGKIFKLIVGDDAVKAEWLKYSDIYNVYASHKNFIDVVH